MSEDDFTLNVDQLLKDMDDDSSELLAEIDEEIVQMVEELIAHIQSLSSESSTSSDQTT